MGEVMTFDEILADKEYQSEFDKRVAKALDTAREKWETEKSGLAEQIKLANEEIERFKGMDIEGVKTAASEWETKYNKAQEEATAKIAEMEYSSVLKDALSGEKFSSTYARDGIMSEICGKKLPLTDGKIVGLEETMNEIRKAQPDAFIFEQAPNLRGAAMGTGGQPPAGLTGKEAAMAAAQKAMGLKT